MSPQRWDFTVDREGRPVLLTDGHMVIFTGGSGFLALLALQATFLVTKDHKTEVLAFVNMFSLESDPLGGPKVSQKNRRAKKTNSVTLGGHPLLPTWSTCSCPADLLVEIFDILRSPKSGLGIGEDVSF